MLQTSLSRPQAVDSESAGATPVRYAFSFARTQSEIEEAQALTRTWKVGTPLPTKSKTGQIKEELASAAVAKAADQAARARLVAGQPAATVEERSSEATSAMPLVLASSATITSIGEAEVNVLDINLVGPVISVRPYTHTDHYWQVYFDTNEAILRHLTKKHPDVLNEFDSIVRMVTLDK